MKITDYELRIADEIERYLAEKMTEEKFSVERVLVSILANHFTIEDPDMHVKGDEFGRDLQETMETVGK